MKFFSDELHGKMFVTNIIRKGKCKLFLRKIIFDYFSNFTPFSKQTHAQTTQFNRKMSGWEQQATINRLKFGLFSVNVSADSQKNRYEMIMFSIFHFQFKLWLNKKRIKNLFTENTLKERNYQWIKLLPFFCRNN